VVNVSRLSEKVALVTSASKGIGAGIATALAAAGARLVVNYSSDREGAEHIARAIIDSRGEAIAVGADISKAADVAQLFKEVDSAFGRLDVLVNNAGAVLAGKTPLGPARSRHRYRTPGSVPGIRRINLDHQKGDPGGRRTCCSHLSAMSRPL
jgi:NAD(P)-dependent dehydrogenase (short-subunit alcohol dehydrogenase family)